MGDITRLTYKPQPQGKIMFTSPLMHKYLLCIRGDVNTRGKTLISPVVHTIFYFLVPVLKS
jgi:hypothetical protein